MNCKAQPPPAPHTHTHHTHIYIIHIIHTHIHIIHTHTHHTHHTHIPHIGCRLRAGQSHLLDPMAPAAPSLRRQVYRSVHSPHSRGILLFAKKPSCPPVLAPPPSLPPSSPQGPARMLVRTEVWDGRGGIKWPAPPGVPLALSTSPTGAPELQRRQPHNDPPLQKHPDPDQPYFKITLYFSL